MKIGLIGYQGSGKSSLFEWLTGIKADPALSHASQSAMAAVPDVRVEPLCGIYTPKKITLASLELVDTAGLNRTHEGNAARLGLIREAGAVVVVVAAFDRSADPVADLRRLDEDLLLADLQIVSGRVERLRESTKKPRPGATRNSPNWPRSSRLPPRSKPARRSKRPTCPTNSSRPPARFAC